MSRSMILAGYLTALFSCLQLSSGGYIPPTKYLIISNARNGTIGYVQLSRSGELTNEVRTLIDRDLAHPQGIAVDQKRQLLLVADSELRKVVSYGLTVHEDGSLGVDEQTPVAEDIETRWVGVDGQGTIYATDEQRGKILKITARQVLDGDTAVTSVFSDRGNRDEGGISSPGGIATDNFHVFWSNKQDGQAYGTVVKALTGPPNSTEATMRPSVVAKNLPKAYGVCLALDTIYFTDSDHNVYAVKTSGGDVAKVTSELANPRGCVWDGENTIYIADRSADAIFALHGPTLTPGEVTAQKVVQFEGAFGVAMFSSAFRGWRASSALWMSLVVALLMSAPLVDLGQSA